MSCCCSCPSRSCRCLRSPAASAHHCRTTATPRPHPSLIAPRMPSLSATTSGRNSSHASHPGSPWDECDLSWRSGATETTYTVPWSRSGAPRATSRPPPPSMSPRVAMPSPKRSPPSSGGSSMDTHSLSFPFAVSSTKYTAPVSPANGHPTSTSGTPSLSTSPTSATLLPTRSAWDAPGARSCVHCSSAEPPMSSRSTEPAVDDSAGPPPRTRSTNPLPSTSPTAAMPCPSRLPAAMGSDDVSSVRSEEDFSVPSSLSVIRNTAPESRPAKSPPDSPTAMRSCFCASSPR
mmetsp:Transcript_20137/g.68278  ORF Transcript_20137/g.68278 Transcript_20137/m.68278 type:complete len:290 (-) Transcript_20137:749-1618(-)